MFVNFYHVARNLQTSLNSWSEDTREGNPQRHTSHGGQEELIVHEDVVGKHSVVILCH